MFGDFCLYLFYSDLCRTYAYIFNSLKICEQVLYSSLLVCIGFVVAYSIPMEYVHKFLVFLTHEEVLGV